MMTPFEFFGRLDLPGRETSVPAARHFVRDVLTGTGFDRIDDVELLVSELVANSLAHVGGALSVAVTRGIADLLVEVTDQGSPTSRPHLRPPPDGEGPGGFGLVLVDELASAWGSYALENCQVAWFTLPHPDAASLRGRGPVTFDELFALFDAARSAVPSLPRRSGRSFLSIVHGSERS